MIRPLRLAQVAAEAEILRWQRMAARTAYRAAYAAIALIFLVAVLANLHILVALWLLPKFGAVTTSLIMLAGDLVLLIGFSTLAAMSSPGAIEREALQVREAARVQLVEAAATASLIAPLVRLLGNRSLFRVAMAGFMAKMFTSAMRR